MRRHLTALASSLVLAVSASAVMAQDTDYALAARQCFAEDGTTHGMVRDYYGCIAQNAGRLEPSGAQPDQIATAAAMSCSAALAEIDLRFDQCQVVFETVIGDNFATTSRRVVREGAQSTAVSAVIEMRAARAAG